LYGFTIQRQDGQHILVKGNVVFVQKISKIVAWVINSWWSTTLSQSLGASQTFSCQSTIQFYL